jgi:hypothetical protein
MTTFIYLVDTNDDSRFLFKQPLAKFNKNTKVGVYCTFPMKSIIQCTAKNIEISIEKYTKMYHQNTLQDFIKQLTFDQENKSEFDNNVIDYELAMMVQRQLSQNKTDFEINVIYPPIDTNLCYFCGGTADKKCSGCKSTFYCTKQCQKADWNFHHKTICALCTREAFIDEDNMLWVH